MTETRALVWLLLATALRSWESVSLWWVLRWETYRRVAILEVKGQNPYGEGWWGSNVMIQHPVERRMLRFVTSDTLEVRRCGGLVVVRSSPNWAAGVRAFALRSVLGHNTVISRCLSPCKCTNAGGKSCDGLAFHPRASRNTRSPFVLRRAVEPFGSYTDLTSLPLLTKETLKHKRCSWIGDKGCIRLWA